MGCKVSVASFGRLPDGRAVEAVTLADARGCEVRIITLGAAIQAVSVPDRRGRRADLVPGFATAEAYLADRHYFGATVGRVANRIAGGRFRLDGRAYRVPVNNGTNSLHGGSPGFDKAVWALVATSAGEKATATLRHVSPDGDQGYPGTLTVTASYALDDAGALSVEYLAATEAPTIVNITNHVYWNLAGEGSPAGAMGHVLTIPGEHYLPTDAGAIPTGEIRPVAGTPFDFRRPTRIGERVRDGADEQIRFGRGYDHCWAIAREPSPELRLLARLEDPETGRILEILSDQPGLQFYSGNFLDGTTLGKSGRLYRMGDAVALEPQMFPDTPNRPEFGSIRLDPGDRYRSRIAWRFSTAD